MTPALWFIVQETFVCAPPKCGGTALYRSALRIGSDIPDRHVFSAALSRAEFFTPEQMLTSGLKAVMAVRDPVSRFGSLWRDKCRDTDENIPELSGLSPDQLMDVIEANAEGNSHWMPQAVHYREGVELVYYRRLLCRLKLPLIKANRTRLKHSDPAFPIKRIVAHYRTDVELISRSAPEAKLIDRA